MAACCGLEHLLGGIVEIVELDAVSKKRKEMGKGEKVSGGLDSRCGFVAAYFSSRRVQLVSSDA